MRVAIQGEAGSYHHIAAESYFGADGLELVCCETFGAVFQALDAHQANVAIVAAENSIAGTVHAVYDLLLSHGFFITGEIYEHIHHCFIGLPVAKFQDIRRVYSHPMALPQCSAFLDENLPHAERIEYSDTAASVSLIKDAGDPHSAAIASVLAAKLNDLPVLHANIENYPNNVTRFLVLEHEHRAATANKASLALETPHQPGALWHALGVFAGADINLTKLESRPIPDAPWRYQFLVDVEAAGQTLHTAIRELQSAGCTVRILGEYPAAAKTIS